MYLSFYGLSDKPFSITPDPRYLFLGGRHAEALAHLIYGITDSGGFVQLTGEVGTGKTTVIRSLLARKPEQAEIALIINPRLDAAQFLQAICEELGIVLQSGAVGNLKELIDLLNRHLLAAHAAGRRVVLIVDEAQNLAPEVLEQVRLLTNLETETQKLLQIILIGQPELRAMLDRNDLRQLAQRITGRYHLEPLSREESAAYLRHRLRIAGATQEIFTRGAMLELYRATGGVPRLLNVVGDRALLGGYTEDRHVVNAALVRRAASEVSGRRVLPLWLPWLASAVAVMLLATGTALVWQQQQQQQRPHAVMASKPGSAAAARPHPATSSAAPGAAAAAASPPSPPSTAATGGVPASTATSLPALLRASAAAATMDSAYTALFSLWGAHYVAGAGDACAQALQQGLDCLSEAGGLASLRRYNRPALLTLADDAGDTHQAVVTRLGTDNARLLLGTAEHEVPLAELEPRWNGELLLLWRPVQPEGPALSLGMSGDAVQALRQRLQQWAGIPPESASYDVYDESLQQLVLQFQRSTGLTADGVAGARTQALLDARLPAPGTPLLSAALE